MTEKSPWQTLGSRVAYTNEWMTIHEDRVIRPDGTPGVYAYMESSIATGVVALTPDDRVYLVGQYRYTTKSYSWEIVEGGTDPGESPLEAAQRELREEAGLAAADWSQLGGPFHLSNCLSSEVGYVYVARGLTDVGAEPEPTEQLTVRVLPLDDCLALVDTGEITDSVSIIALLRLARQREGAGPGSS